MKYTLGPWLCAPNTPGIKPTTRGVIAPRSENMLLATVYNPAGRIKEREANARLIAAAPELLEALTTFLAAGESILGRSSQVEIDYLEAAIKTARSAIAIAT